MITALPSTSPAGNLPILRSPLLGREREAEALHLLLQRPDVSLVTLSGPGGTGKTLLALHVAATLRDAFADGVWFVDLAPLRDPALVISTIARTLAVQVDPIGTPLQALQDELGSRQILLVLDNVEQVIEASPAVAALLGACPGLKILATSRAPLHISPEHHVPLGPLAVPAPHPMLSVEELDRYGAIQLFAMRAQAVDPAFVLDAATAPLLVEICRKLDGLPLAIELAAARTRHLPPRAMLPKLERRLALLTGGSRDLPDRQRTMRGAIAWSYELLAPSEQTLFRRLAVFSGGFTLEAAEVVSREVEASRSGADSEPDLVSTPRLLDASTAILDSITALVDESLVRPAETQDGVPRFDMLETIREFAQEQLDAAGETDASRCAHAGYFLALTEQAEAELAGRDQAEWLDLLETDRDNLRAALRWALDHGETEIALRMGAALWPFWFRRGYVVEGRTWLERALEADPAATPDIRAKALHRLGNLALDLADYGRADAFYAAGLALWREIGNQHRVADALNGLGLVAAHRGDYDRARELHEEALAIRRELGDDYGIGLSLNNLGLVASAVGDVAAARHLFERTLATWQHLGNAHGVAYVHLHLSRVARYQGDPVGARHHGEEALTRFQRLGDRPGVAAACHCLGDVEQDEGDNAAAVIRYQEALDLWQELGDKRGIIECLEGLAGVATDRRAAARLIAAASAWRAALEAPLAPADRAAHERDVEAIRRALGTTVFASEMELGRAQDLTEASTLALGITARSRSTRGSSMPGNDLGLTPREIEVLRLLTKGDTDQNIADALFISKRTASTHVGNILAKLGVESRAAAAVHALRLGIVANP